MGDLARLAATYLGYRARRETCAYPPTRVWLETTADCNLRCSFCGNRLLTADQRGYMDLEFFRDLANESAGRVRRFNLFHRGEPLLHPRIAEMVGYAEQKGIRTRINTNGILLDAETGRELIQAGLDMLSISFDGYDRRMYEMNRPGADFGDVLSNIIGFLEIKKRLGAGRPFTALELMEISDLSPSELACVREAFRRRFDGLPLDKFVIRRPHNWAGLVDMGEDHVERRIPCPLLWHALVVFWDGRVLPCPQDFFGKLELGNARDTGLMKIWNGERLRELRREMADVGFLKRHPCLECDRIRRRTVAGVPVDYLGRFLSETVFSGRLLGRILPH